MKNFTLAVILVAVSSSYSRLLSQVPDLGTAEHFVLFTSAGAVGNTGISDVIGDVGSHVGAITGFEDITGTVYNADAITAQAGIDVMSAYNQLLNTPATSTAHTPAFGSGETLFSGVYSITGAASIAGSLTLDAQGDPNAIFIFKAGGALTTAASTTIYLINSATADNIFWIAEGAISMAASTTIAGTFIANNGAVDMGNGSILEGRLLSTAGAVSLYGTHAFVPGNSVLSINFLSLTGSCEGSDTRLTWAPTNTNSNDITIEVSRDGFHWNNLIKINEREKAWLQHTLLFTDQSSFSSPSFYRLQQKNDEGKKEYGTILRMVPCTIRNIDQLSIYPNPSNGIIRLSFEGNANEVYSTTITNINGNVVYSSMGISNYINILNLPQGIYVVRVKSASSQLSHTLMKL